MNTPVISVILPAYNCEAFIHKAVESVLRQTFHDFELIIINDGSADKTESIILSFNDPRIDYHKNTGNKGLIFTLNKAIDLARGKYIARMDADDICLPDRLAKQKEFLDQHPDIAIVATTVDFINEEDEKTGIWELDRKTITARTIRQKMPAENCIAHPTVMIRAEKMKEFKYLPDQKNIEDYDLWLRLLNRGYQIAKIDEPLLLYRLHPESVTNIHLKTVNSFFKHMWMKTRFLFREFFSGHTSGYIFRVLIYAKLDFFKGIGKAIKNIFR